jgi:glutamate/tyrosine decarboxylase-like PLP-dependent enzyme
LQPYGCGCVLFRDPATGHFYKHDSPYTYFSSAELHLGEISLECSRPGAAAAALWATQKLLPPVRGGEFARGLQDGRAAALAFYDRLTQDDRFRTAFAPELDIVIFAPRAKSVSMASALSRRIFDAAAKKNLHLALAELPAEFWAANRGAMQHDRETMTCLRSVLMKPEHLEWIPQIWDTLSAATSEVLGAQGSSRSAR